MSKIYCNICCHLCPDDQSIENCESHSHNQDSYYLWTAIHPPCAKSIMKLACILQLPLFSLASKFKYSLANHSRTLLLFYNDIARKRENEVFPSSHWNNWSFNLLLPRFLNFFFPILAVSLTMLLLHSKIGNPIYIL